MNKTITPSVHEVPQRVIDRVMDYVDMRGANECWRWKRSLGKTNGYGQITWGVGNRRTAGTTAHRVVWIRYFGPIPKGMTIDHECRYRPCCNPRHFRLRTLVDNARDNSKYRQTHCIRGHEFDEHNTKITTKGRRRCKACDVIRNKARYN